MELLLISMPFCPQKENLLLFFGANHLFPSSLPGYIAPRKPYGFEAMLNDILTFASRTLVTNGRLSMWMPTAHDEAELPAPMHPDLDLVSVAVQDFNNCKCLSFFLLLGRINPRRCPGLTCT